MTSVSLVAFLCGTSVWVASSGAQDARTPSVVEEVFLGRGISIQIHFDRQRLADLGVVLRGDDGSGVLQAKVVEGTSALEVVAVDGQYRGLSDVWLEAVAGGFSLQSTAGRSQTLNALRVEPAPFDSSPFDFTVSVGSSPAVPAFGLAGSMTHALLDDRVLEIEADVLMASELARALGHPEGANAFVGVASVSAGLDRIQKVTYDAGGVPTAATLDGVGASSATAGMVGPDVIVVSVFNLTQFGREGPVRNGTLGLAVGTTSCNIGDERADWFELPSVDHPLIAMNLYRLRTVEGSDRME